MSKRHQRKRKHRFLKLVFLFIAAAFIYKGAAYIKDSGSFLFAPSLEAYAKAHNIDMSEYTQGLIDLYEKNPDAKDFVFEYPEKKDMEFEIDLSGYKDSDEVPLFIQWDQRWGYTPYAGSVFGLSGCGPACLSMAAVYLTGDTGMDPKEMAEFASENGYETDGSGTAWSLFSEGAEKLGLDSTEIPLDEERIIENLKVGNPIVCVMGPGDFTSTGHFIVMTGYKDGKIKVNDPNSYKNSKKLWDFDRISSQIKNLWVLRSK